MGEWRGGRGLTESKGEWEREKEKVLHNVYFYLQVVEIVTVFQKNEEREERGEGDGS